MSDELMVEALCWEMARKVTAEFAKLHHHYMYFCPDVTCLERVDAVQRKNCFFRARNGHTDGCAHEKIRSGGLASSSSNRPIEIVPHVIPTVLGPPPQPVSRLPPTREQLMALAHKTSLEPLLASGTLTSVVNAWMVMSPDERPNTPLIISGQQMTYASAFLFLGYAGEEAHLESGQRILFGAAQVSEGDQYFFVKTRKQFRSGEQRFPMNIWISKDREAAEGLQAFVENEATLFWHGQVPRLRQSDRTLFEHQPQNELYSGAVIRPGALAP